MSPVADTSHVVMSEHPPFSGVFVSDLTTCCEGFKPSLTLREENRLRVFENRVLRMVFGPVRGKVTGDWRKQHGK